MVRKATKKKRGVATRKRKNIILLGSEGKNETERRYFNGFKPKLNQYIIMHAGGNNTDPIGVVNNTVDEVNYQELDFEDGDLAFVLLDCDVNKGATNAKKLTKYQENVNPEVSPLHITYTDVYRLVETLMNDVNQA